VDPQRCDGCGECFKACPEVAFRLSDDIKAVLWVLASGGQVSHGLDLAFARTLPGVGKDRITKAARHLLSWNPKRLRKLMIPPRTLLLLTAWKWGSVAPSE